MVCVGNIAVAIVFSFVLIAAPDAQAEPTRTEKIQTALETWVAERAPVEKITGIAAYISFGDPGPAIEAFAGKIGSASQDPPVRQNTLFQMGSTSKSFTAALILELEAAGKLTNDKSLETEGKGDKAKGNLKQAGEKVKDAFRK